MRERLFKIAAILLLTAVLFSGCRASGAETAGSMKKTAIVTSFYPVYIHAINIVRDIPDVEVTNLTQPQTGCLHDYQLTPDNVKLLEGARIFIINGADMESFMDKVVKQLPDLKVVEASKGIELIEEAEHEEGANPHVWVSISGAISQVRNIAGQLAEVDAKNAEKYRKNADEYIKKLEALRERMHQSLDKIGNRDIVTFHEAFPYFAKEFRLNIVSVIEREPGSEPSAAELADTIEKVRETKVKALFVEPQYPAKTAETIARETGAKVSTLDPVVTGTADPKDYDAYLRVMENNMKVLQEALK